MLYRTLYLDYTFILILTIFIPFSNGAARFTQEPPSKLYVVKGGTARFVWHYQLDGGSKLDSTSPGWYFYDPATKRIGYIDKYDGWTIDPNTCPTRLRSPTVRVSTESKDTLVITNVTTADNGVYRCRLGLSSGGSAVTSKVQLIVPETPTFSVRPNATTTINEDSDLSISCTAVGPPIPNVTWVQVQGVTKVTRTQGVGSATLRILSIKRDQSGTVYECQAVNNPSQSPVTTQTVVIVYYPPTINISATSNKEYACIKYIVPLVCRADGNPPPDITWYFPGNITTRSSNELKLNIKDDKQFGNYTCKAINEVGNDSFVVQLMMKTNVTCAPPTSTTPPTTGSSVPSGIIAGVVIAGFLAVAGLVIAIIFCFRRKLLTKDSRLRNKRVTVHMRDVHEEQYASVQATNRVSAVEDEPIASPLQAQYAVVDKSKKKKKNKTPPVEGELVYAELDHDALGGRPSSDRCPTGDSNEPGTLYADIGVTQHQEPPRYGNMDHM